MNLSVTKVELREIQSLRRLFLQETNFQIRYDACHQRGWTTSYLVKMDGAEIGYGSINGREIKDRDTVFEFYLVPPFRKFSSFICSELLAVSKAIYIECQSNDFLLSSMLYEFARNTTSEVMLFKDHVVTNLTVPGVVFRSKHEGDKIFEHKGEPVGEYVLEAKDEVVATGGFLLHYNVPFADLYMEVKEDFRRKGLGSFLVQEVKRECYLAGRVPAARCQIANQASRATLTKAGLTGAGFMLAGDVKDKNV
jgi:GNAT superfamily N-acetyltransferase